MIAIDCILLPCSCAPCHGEKPMVSVVDFPLKILQVTLSISMCMLCYAALQLHPQAAVAGQNSGCVMGKWWEDLEKIGVSQRLSLFFFEIRGTHSEFAKRKSSIRGKSTSMTMFHISNMIKLREAFYSRTLNPQDWPKYIYIYQRIECPLTQIKFPCIPMINSQILSVDDYCSEIPLQLVTTQGFLSVP